MHKVRLWAAEAAKKFRHKTRRFQRLSRHHLFRCFFAFIAQRRLRFHNQFFKQQKQQIMEMNLSLAALNNVSEIDVVYKKKCNCKMSERPLITTSKDGYEVFLHYWNGDKIDLLEEFKVLL